MVNRSEYRVGDLVCLRADPSRSGPIIELLSPAGDKARYRVFHSTTEVRDYYHDQLIPLQRPAGSTDDGDTWAGVDAATFRACLTASRLSHPLVDSLYALHAARIRYIPFQLKPLLRLLRSDRPRMLIADEVGVGKTIEAGLILRELQARQRIRNVLIVCPKPLVSKWHAEMRRFDEDFRPLTSETLRYCLNETHLDGVWPPQYARAIVHLELLRSEEHLYGRDGRRPQPGLLTLDEPPTFDLLIVDEAHHLRNPDTRSFELAKFLCDVSEAVLFLSATPVHLGSQNLFTLLNLLRPDVFLDHDLFRTMLEPNAHLNAAMRSIRYQRPAETWRTNALSSLQQARETAWGRSVLTDDPRLTEWEMTLRFRDALRDDERVRCLRELEELNSLAHVVNRTRRRDIGRFTIREPHTVNVPFTVEQREFYEAVLDFRRELLLATYDAATVRMIMDTLERQAASCLPAIVPLLDRLLTSDDLVFAGLTDAEDTDGADDPGTIRLGEQSRQRIEQVRQVAAALPTTDPKLETLQRIIDDTLASDGPGKLLVFSFFLHTLDYLRDAMVARDYRVALVNGRTPDEERERLRERFRLPRDDTDALDILLSSEVGCEGLDYEFCDRLVNYDIPWNPMRVEQRIGRIDRFGQLSDKVQIYNFITPGTVEERIYYRCFDRIGIFRDTIGDLEEILGDLTRELNAVVMDTRLTPQQQEERAQQQVDNVLRRINEERRIETERSDLLGLESALVEDVEMMVAGGRLVSAADLEQMVTAYVQMPDIAGTLSVDSRQPALRRLRVNRDGRAAMLADLRALEATGRTVTTLTRWLDGSDPHLLLTFDHDLATDSRETMFVTPVHPLARMAIRRWTRERIPFVASLEARSSTLRPSTYVFACFLWEVIALRPEVRLVTLALDTTTGAIDADVSEHLLELLSSATDSDGVIAPDGGQLAAFGTRLDDAGHRARGTALGPLRERNGVLVSRQLAGIDSFFAGRMERVERDLATVADHRIVRMRRAERDRLQREHAERRREIEQRREADIVSQQVAIGLLTIHRGSNNAE